MDRSADQSPLPLDLRVTGGASNRSRVCHTTTYRQKQPRALAYAPRYNLKSPIQLVCMFGTVGGGQVQGEHAKSTLNSHNPVNLDLSLEVFFAAIPAF